MFLVKFGGSVITVKGRYRFFRQKAVSEIIKQLIRTRESFVVVHGGGSFGHIKAKEYGLPGPINEKTIFGFSVVHRDMIDLNQRIISSMIESGLDGVGVSPSMFLGKLEGLLSAFVNFTKMGFSPVTFGDVYVDEKSGRFEIISGDDLMLELSRKLKPSRAVFLTDVDGIYDRNPKKYREAKLLRTMDESASYEVLGTDVTGGMQKKAMAVTEIARLGIPVYILNGNKPSRIHDIGSERFVGTVIK